MEVNELDELFTFGGKKTNTVYAVTRVDRESWCIVDWAVSEARTPEALRAMLDRAPQAKHYYSDGYTHYSTLIYTPGTHTAVLDKSQTYFVEANNAELRHYLARLARKSRCFSRCLRAL